MQYAYMYTMYVYVYIHVPQNTLRTPPPSVDLSPLECHALQREEVEMLSAIYGPDLQPLNDQGTCFLVNIRFLSDEISEDDVIKIWFRCAVVTGGLLVVLQAHRHASGVICLVFRHICWVSPGHMPGCEIDMVFLFIMLECVSCHCLSQRCQY